MLSYFTVESLRGFFCPAFRLMFSGYQGSCELVILFLVLLSDKISLQMMIIMGVICAIMVVVIVSKYRKTPHQR